MSNGSTVTQTPPTKLERVLGRVAGDPAGPTVVVMTGIHGNEPSGAAAAQRVLDRLRAQHIEIHGEVVVLAGNLEAQRQGARYIDNDLNRHWTPAGAARVRSTERTPDEPAEEQERRELLEVLSGLVAEARGQVYFLDLHTSSADGAPFLTVGDTLRNRSFAMHLPLPLMLGLEEQVDGSLLEFLNNYGFVTLGVEAGQHDCPLSIDRHEAVLWLAMIAAGVLDAGQVGERQRYRRMLREASRGTPRVMEVRYRHPIDENSDFRMEPGFKSFQQIEKGALLAHDRNGPVLAPQSGQLLLPLYQGKGDDGFFISREVRLFWLRVSALLRRLYLDALIGLLPGVRRHPDDGEVLVVSTRIARAYPLEIFHLFGYRKLRRIGSALVVSRRRYDLTPPAKISL